MGAGGQSLSMLIRCHQGRGHGQLSQGLPAAGPQRAVFCRSGVSGKGDLVINRYDVAGASWTRLHNQLMSGEVRRASPDIASNQDLGSGRTDRARH